MRPATTQCVVLIYWRVLRAVVLTLLSFALASSFIDLFCAVFCLQVFGFCGSSGRSQRVFLH